MRKHLVSTLAAIIAAVSLAAYAAPQATPAPATPAAPAAAAAKATIGKPAPNFTLQDSNGKTVNLSDFKGKTVILEWVNVDCPIDQRVVTSKLISNVFDKHKEKTVWLAIDSTHNHLKADYDKTISQWKLTYPLLNDAKGVVGKLYDAKTTPQMYVINTEGILVYNGAIDDDPDGKKTEKVNYLDKALVELFGGKPISLTETKPYGCTVKYAQ